MTWLVDGEPLQARLFRWADGWTGFVGLSRAALIASGRGVEPEGLRFTVTDGTGYHADLRAELRFPQTLREARSAALGDAADDEPVFRPTHPDELALLEG